MFAAFAAKDDYRTWFVWPFALTMAIFTTDAINDRSTTYLAMPVSSLNLSFVTISSEAGGENALLGTVPARTRLACGFACFANPQCMAFYFEDQTSTGVTSGNRCDLLGSVSSNLNYSTVFVDLAGPSNFTAFTTNPNAVTSSTTKVTALSTTSTYASLAVSVDNVWDTGARVTVSVPSLKPSKLALYTVQIPCVGASIASIWDSTAANWTLLAAQGVLLVSQTDWQLTKDSFGFNLAFPQRSCQLISSNTVVAYRMW